jgi:hypothetical protein
MASLHVTCINKHPTHQDRHHRIQAIGGAWGRHSEDEAIQHIDSGANTYYTTGDGLTAKVLVVKHSGGKRYLKTDSDTTTRDNLLSLPECR